MNLINLLSISCSILFLVILSSSKNSGAHCIGIANLQESISELEVYVKNLTIKLRETESRLSRIEDDCKCINYKSENQIKLNSESHIVTSSPSPHSPHSPHSSQSSQSSQSSESVSSPFASQSQLKFKVTDRLVKVKQSTSHCLLANGSTVLHSSKWISNCSNCLCDFGSINCSPVKCPSLTGSCKPSSLYFASSTDCCPVCHKRCLKDGKYIEHNDVYTKDCVKCVCLEGSLRCKKLNPTTHCPPLDCPIEKQFKADGECCKYCVDTDFCAAGHDCHSSAQCINLKTGFTCKCLDGYWGDGKTCSDVNECDRQGGSGGNLCRDNTKCVNTNGSYHCECLPGFKRRDSLNCIDVDECASNENKCNRNAKCINTHGNYTCECLEGFTGDGVNCQPICKQKCANGGKCVGPNRCSCKRGFHGKLCEKDVDECTLGLHECPSNSKCINKPGWYYCQCQEGYKSYFREGDQLQCVDINECDLGMDTCNEERECVNTDGGYMCQCPSSSESLPSPSSSSLFSFSPSPSSPSSSSCSKDCVSNGLRRSHGSKWGPETESGSCFECSCSFGVTKCSKKECDCDSDEVDSKCCPQCKKSTDCVDERDESRKYKNGETWLSKCKSCQCLSGESKCHDMDCPPIKCSNPIKSNDDCCPYCDDDPCGDYVGDDNGQGEDEDNLIKPGISINSSLSSGCMYLGKSYANDEQIVMMKDPCANCKCKNGRLCCTYNANCLANSSSTRTNLNTINSIETD